MALSAALLFLATHAGCAGGDKAVGPTTPPPEVTLQSVTLTASRQAVLVGETATLTVTATGSDGRPFANAGTPTFTVVPARVGTVSGTTFTAADTGLSQITVSLGGRTATAGVSVALVPVRLVTLSLDSAALLMGDTLRVAHVARDSANGTLANRAVTWSSSATAVATVGASGLVTAVGQGLATITATVEGRTASATVRVGLRVQGQASPTTPTTIGSVGTGVQVEVPAGAVPTSTTFTAVPAAPATLPSDAGVVAGTAFTFGPAGTTFAQPVTISIAFRPESLPAGVARRDLGLHKLVDGQWVQAVRSTVDSVAGAVRAGVGSFSTWGIRARRVASLALAAPSRNVLSGDSLVLRGALLDLFGDTLAFRALSFTSSDTSRVSVSAAGVARATRAGPVTVTARLGALEAMVDLVVLPGAPAQLLVTAGAGQRALAGSVLPVPPLLAVLDAHGNAVAGVQVTFSTGAGNGSVAEGADVSDADGVVSPGAWTLSASSGLDTLTAAYPGGAPVHLVARGYSDVVATAAIESGDAQSAALDESVPLPLRVLLRDANGHGVPDSPVVFSYRQPGGTTFGIVTTIVRTDADGVASLGSWVLRGSTGTHTITATAGSLAPVTFTATAR